MLPKSSQFQEIIEQFPGVSLNNTNVMLLLNFAVECMTPDEVYCEIESFGLTLISALLNHPEFSAYSVSSFSKIDNGELYCSQLFETLVNWNLENQVLVCDGNIEEFIKDLQDLNSTDKIGVCFLNSGDSYRDNLLSLVLLKEFLSDSVYHHYNDKL